MKKPNYASNAVYALLHGFYGKRLTPKNYKELLSLGSVNEVAEYLKSKTVYSEIFEGITINSELQRSRLENLLFEKLYNDLDRLIRFENATGTSLYEYFIMKYDLRQLLNVMGSLETKSDSYFFSFPVFYNERSKLDLYKVAMSKSLDELSANAEHTVYYPTLRSAAEKYRITGNLTEVQKEFAVFLDKEFIGVSAGKKAKKPDDKSEITVLYKTLRDVSKLKSLHRLKRFGEGDLQDKTVPDFGITLFTKKQVQRIIDTANNEELTEAIKGTYLKKMIPDVPAGKETDFSNAADNYVYSLFSKTAARSTDPQAVMFAYMWLAENEIKNIIHIIEGIRYGMAPEEIMPMLCGTGTNR